MAVPLPPATSAQSFPPIADQTTFVAGGQAFSIAITAGATKGSTDLNLADLSDLAVGPLIVISADNEPGLVYASGGSTHDSKQMAVITAISRNTIMVTPPLIWSFSPPPVVLYSFVGINRFVGLEDMKVDHALGGSGASFMLDQCYGCWVRGMYSYKPGGYHTYVLDSLLGEIRDCFFLDSQFYGSNNAGLNVRGTTNGGVNQGAVTGFKFENNIFDKTFPGVELQNVSSGNYVGYNYSYATQPGDYTPGGTYVGWNTAMFDDNHRPHDMMNLWEGNTGEQFTSDGYLLAPINDRGQVGLAMDGIRRGPVGRSPEAPPPGGHGHLLGVSQQARRPAPATWLVKRRRS